MSSQGATTPPTVDPTILPELKEHVRRNRSESDPFRLEIEAISTTENRTALVERIPTLVRLCRRAGP